jgi:hypothetical protein
MKEKLVEIKGSSYKVGDMEFCSYIPSSELKDMKQSKVDEIWSKMKKSEKFGCSMAMFPAWVLDYKLTHEETCELMDKR